MKFISPAGMALLCVGLAQGSIVLAAPTGAAKMSSGNAFDTYGRASALMQHRAEIDDAGSSTPKRPYSDAEKATLSRDNAPVLALVRRGLGQSYSAPPIRSGDQLFPYYAKDRALIRLLGFDADVRLAHGDSVGALSACIDGIQFGRQIERGAPLIGRLVGIACQSIALKHAWMVMNSPSVKLSGGDIRKTLSRLESLASSPYSYAETLVAERKVGHLLFQAAFDKKDQATATALQPYGGPKSVLAAYDHYMDVLIERGRGRYGVTERRPLPPVPKDPMNSNLVDVLWGGRIRVADVEETQSALLAAALALRAYRVGHGRYPTSLSALAPAYLGKIPEDPFAVRGPLHYRMTGPNAYILYSVGPDGQDDGGRAIDNPGAQNDRQRGAVNAGSKGDVVAGTNS